MNFKTFTFVVYDDKYDEYVTYSYEVDLDAYVDSLSDEKVIEIAKQIYEGNKDEFDSIYNNIFDFEDYSHIDFFRDFVKSEIQEAVDFDDDLRDDVMAYFENDAQKDFEDSSY